MTPPRSRVSGEHSRANEQEGLVDASAIALGERRGFEMARELAPEQRLEWFEQL
jgi:hypothetical protein